MTFRELRKQMAGLTESLNGMADFAERDEFAPWVVESLRRAAFYANLSDEAVGECKADLLEPTQT